VQVPLAGKISSDINNVINAIGYNAAAFGSLEENTSNAARKYLIDESSLCSSCCRYSRSESLSREYQVIIQMVFRPAACRTMITSLLSHSLILILIIGSCAAVTAVSGDYPH